MTENDWWKDLKNRLSFFATQFASTLINSGFLAFWVFIQWTVKEYIIKRLKLSGIDNWVLLVFQVIFAISTLVPIILYIYEDIRVMIKRVQRRIQDKMELSKENDSNDK